MFAPEVVHGSEKTSLHIAYSNGDVCNGTRQYHTDLYIHCANQTVSACGVKLSTCDLHVVSN